MKIRALDAGGSVTRCARSKKEIFQIPSVCMEISPDSPAKGHIIDNKVLDFEFKKCPCASLVGRRFVKAEARHQYSGDLLVCDNNEIKVLQEITYINILYALAVDSIRYNFNDEDFKIGVCIPAAEYYDDENDRINEIKDNLAGDTAIYFPMLDRTIRFSIDKKNIGVVAEGVVAAFRFKHDRGFVLKNTAVIDVGYRSTDITILIQFSPVGASAASRPIGGINMEAAIQSRLERDNIFVSTSVVQKSLSSIQVVDSTQSNVIDITDYIQRAKDEQAEDYIGRALESLTTDGYGVTRNQIETALKSYYIIQGQDIVDISEYVHSTKELFADEIYKAVQNVVNAKMMNVGDISNVLCVGRPFGGDINDQYNLVNLLRNKFKDDVKMYVMPDAGVANVVEMAGLLGPESDV